MGCTISCKCRHPNSVLDCNVSNRQRSHNGFERHRDGCKLVIESEANVCFVQKRCHDTWLAFIVVRLDFAPSVAWLATKSYYNIDFRK